MTLPEQPSKSGTFASHATLSCLLSAMAGLLARIEPRIVALTVNCDRSTSDHRTRRRPTRPVRRLTRGRGTLVDMGELKRTVLTTSEAALPRGQGHAAPGPAHGREPVVTAAFVAFAVAASVGYQLIRWRASRLRSTMTPGTT